MYQAFNRESGHLPREQLGHFGLIDPETRGAESCPAGLGVNCF